MSLKEKAQDFGHKMMRAIIFFLVLGIIMMVFAVTMLSKTFSDITSTISPPAPQTTTPQTTTGTTPPAPQTTTSTTSTDKH